MGAQESGKKELKQITHRITTAHVTVEGKGILPYAQITEVLHAVQENLNGAR